jgi:hypothetical protein
MPARAKLIGFASADVVRSDGADVFGAGAEQVTDADREANNSRTRPNQGVGAHPAQGFKTKPNVGTGKAAGF